VRAGLPPVVGCGRDAGAAQAQTCVDPSWAACDRPRVDARRLTVSGASLGGRALELSLDDLKTGRYGPTMHMQASLQVGVSAGHRMRRAQRSQRGR
jgi:hypothetical protein